MTDLATLVMIGIYFIYMFVEVGMLGRLLRKSGKLIHGVFGNPILRFGIGEPAQF